MALLSLLKDWTDISRLVAVTIDHGFREGRIIKVRLVIESAREAAQVHEWVHKMGITHVTKKIDWVCAWLSRLL